MAVIRSVDLPFVRVEYDRSAPSTGGLAVTRAGSIAVAFTEQACAHWVVDNRHFEGRFPAAVSLTGESEVTWLRWSDTSEAVEFWLSDRWLEGISGVRDASKRADPRTSIRDPLLEGIAAEMRRAMSSDDIDPIRFEELAVAASRRIVPHAAVPDKSPRLTLLEDRRLRTISDYIEANLGGSITLQAMADIAASNMFHFAKRFRAATGTAPYAFVVARRMTRAMQLLRAGETVSETARVVGYSQVGHFRRQFRRHWGQLPGSLEA